MVVGSVFFAFSFKGVDLFVMLLFAVYFAWILFICLISTWLLHTNKKVTAIICSLAIVCAIYLIKVAGIVSNYCYSYKNIL